MNIWIAFAGGIILGWVIEWVIDWLYWRRGIEGFYATESELRSELQIAQQQQAESAAALSGLQGELQKTQVIRSG